jgi:5-methyltetrahydrofolate--homocysteine methyltransferase
MNTHPIMFSAHVLKAYFSTCKLRSGPDEIERVIGEMAAVKPAGIYLIAQSNAGLPKYLDKKISYDGTPEVMAGYALKMKALGINYIGACCGSTPAHIAAMREALAG